MLFSHPPILLSAWFTQIAAALDRRSAPRLCRLFLPAARLLSRQKERNYAIPDLSRPGPMGVWPS